MFSLSDFRTPRSRRRAVSVGEDELSSPFGDVGELFGQLGLEIPGKRENDVGAVLFDLDGVVDRDAGARGEATVLVWIAVDGVLEKIAANAAVVEKRVALAGGSVPDHPFALCTAVEQKTQ